ncbi:hypothetical protein BASA83_004590 [Batrachochytrium salamandrivorans]|nr:hypothetical protein BASA83_004590 [Batrachochytrium salamandrivorans]
MDEHVIKARRHQLKQTNQFRQDFQQPHQRRDYDLYDPKALQKDHSAREIDGSGVSKEINISSLQRFEGEDLAAKTRLNLQKDQMRVWANEQVYEKERRSQEELDEKRRYEQFQKNITDKMSVLQHSVEVAHRDQACLDREYNMSMAAEKRRKEQQDKVYETELNTREILSHVNGAFLTEKSDMLNTSGSHKVCVSQFKGNTVEQNSKIMEAQQQQRMDHQKLRAAQIDEDERWAIQDTMYSRTMNLLERQKTRSAREKAILIRKENEAKAIQDKDRKRYIDKVLYTNQPQDSYFNQFNTTSR